MSLFFPRVAFAPSRCAPLVARPHDFAPLFSLFDDSFNELQRVGRHARRQFVPRFDVKEVKENYTVDAELPGIDAKDVSIEFTDEHTLTIKGRTERHTESGTRPTDVVEAQEKPAVEETAAATPASDAASTKSHQPTVEDEDGPANSSVATNAAESSEVAAPAPKEAEKSEPQHKYWISERRVGEFTRSFNFPARVDQEAVKASLKNGILSIVVPKAAVPESRRIQIE